MFFFQPRMISKFKAFAFRLSNSTHPDSVNTCCPEDGYMGTQPFQHQNKAPQLVADSSHGCPSAPSVGKVLTCPFSLAKRGHEHLCLGINILHVLQSNPKELCAVSLCCWCLPSSPAHADEGGNEQSSLSKGLRNNLCNSLIFWKSSSQALPW